MAKNDILLSLSCLIKPVKDQVVNRNNSKFMNQNNKPKFKFEPSSTSLTTNKTATPSRRRSKESKIERITRNLKIENKTVETYQLLLNLFGQGVKEKYLRRLGDKHQIQNLVDDAISSGLVVTHEKSKPKKVKLTAIPESEPDENKSDVESAELDIQPSSTGSLREITDNLIENIQNLYDTASQDAPIWYDLSGIAIQSQVHVTNVQPSGNKRLSSNLKTIEETNEPKDDNKLKTEDSTLKKIQKKVTNFSKRFSHYDMNKYILDDSTKEADSQTKKRSKSTDEKYLSLFNDEESRQNMKDQLLALDADLKDMLSRTESVKLSAKQAFQGVLTRLNDIIVDGSLILDKDDFRELDDKGLNFGQLKKNLKTLSQFYEETENQPIASQSQLTSQSQIASEPSDRDIDINTLNNDDKTIIEKLGTRFSKWIVEVIEFRDFCALPNGNYVIVCFCENDCIYGKRNRDDIKRVSVNLTNDQLQPTRSVNFLRDKDSICVVNEDDSAIYFPRGPRIIVTDFELNRLSLWTVKEIKSDIVFLQYRDRKIYIVQDTDRKTIFIFERDKLDKSDKLERKIDIENILVANDRLVLISKVDTSVESISFYEMNEEFNFLRYHMIDCCNILAFIHSYVYLVSEKDKSFYCFNKDGFLIKKIRNEVLFDDIKLSNKGKLVYSDKNKTLFLIHENTIYKCRF